MGSGVEGISILKGKIISKHPIFPAVFFSPFVFVVGCLFLSSPGGGALTLWRGAVLLRFFVECSIFSCLHFIVGSIRLSRVESISLIGCILISLFGWIDFVALC